MLRNVVHGYGLILKAPMRKLKIARPQVEAHIREDILDTRAEAGDSEYTSHHGPSPPAPPSKYPGPQGLLSFSWFLSAFGRSAAFA